MSSRRDDHTRRDQGSAREHVFLVGVEFLARGLSSRGGRQQSPESPAERESRNDEGPSSSGRRQAAGKVPPVARAARTVADTRLHATEVEHRAFSAEESLAELRELSTSAGAVIAGEMQQRRQ